MLQKAGRQLQSQLQSAAAAGFVSCWFCFIPAHRLRKLVLDAAGFLPLANMLEAMPTAEMSTYEGIKYHIEHRVHNARKAQTFGSTKFRQLRWCSYLHQPGIFQDVQTLSLIVSATQLGNSCAW